MINLRGHNKNTFSFEVIQISVLIAKNDCAVKDGAAFNFYCVPAFAGRSLDSTPNLSKSLVHIINNVL